MLKMVIIGTYSQQMSLFLQLIIFNRTFLLNDIKNPASRYKIGYTKMTKTLETMEI